MLAPKQIEDLLKLMRRLKAEGRTIVFISHKLEEVMSVADAITVMRVGPRRSDDDAGQDQPLRRSHAPWSARRWKRREFEPRPRSADAPLFSARGLVGADAMGFDRLGPIDLEVFPGEIVGVAGVAGNRTGRTRRLLGRPRHAGRGPDRHRRARPDAKASAAGFRAAGVGYVSPDRADEGFVPRRLYSRQFRRWARARTQVLALRRHAALRHRRCCIARARPSFGAFQCARGSGGKLVRWQPAAACPRRANSKETLDFSLRRSRLAASTSPGQPSSMRMIASFRDRGGAVLLVSESLDEILALSDRIVCLYNGKLAGEMLRGDASVGVLGQLMLGQRAA